MHNIKPTSRTRLRIIGPGLLLVLICGIATVYFLQSRNIASTFKTGTEVIIFKSTRSDPLALYMINADGTQQTHVVDVTQPSPYWWLPAYFRPKGISYDAYVQLAADGRSLSFLSTHEGTCAFYNLRLLDGTVTPAPSPDVGRDNCFKMWSPDGQQLAYMDNASEIIVIDRNGTNRRCLTCTIEGSAWIGAWSPDSRRLTFTSSDPAGTVTDLFRIDADGTNFVRLTDAPGSLNYEPVWSPDGQKIVYTTNKDGSGGFELYVINTDGTNPVRLTTTNSDGMATWSPDGQRIAFVSSRHANTNGMYTSDREDTTSDIYIMNADGTNPTRLTSDAADNYAPKWIRLPASLQ